MLEILIEKNNKIIESTRKHKKKKLKDEKKKCDEISCVHKQNVY